MLYRLDIQDEWYITQLIKEFILKWVPNQTFQEVDVSGEITRTGISQLEITQGGVKVTVTIEDAEKLLKEIKGSLDRKTFLPYEFVIRGVTHNQSEFHPDPTIEGLIQKEYLIGFEFTQSHVQVFH